MALLLIAAASAGAQVRERPVPFDTAGRIMAITPPLAARLGLIPPAWTVVGDYLDARLYSTDDSTGNAVLVVRRQQEVLERYPLSPSQRTELAMAIARGTAQSSDRESVVSTVSEPVKGSYVVSQSVLGGLLFAPLAASLTDNPTAGTATYLLVSGATFFIAANRVKGFSVSRAQDHLAWHLSWQGAASGYLAAYAIGGDSLSDKGLAAAALFGGIVGDIAGDRIARPYNDGEAHGFSHGAIVTAALTTGLLGTAGLSDEEGTKRAAAVAVLGAQVIGYPLGLRYARNTRYHVTSGDVGTLLVGEVLGVTAAASIVGHDGADDQVVAAALTAGFALGAVVADRMVVVPFDYTESESRFLQFGTAAGAVVGLAIPLLAESDTPAAYFGAATAGGLLGALLTHHLIEPARATRGRSATLRTGAAPKPSRVQMRFTPQNLVFVQGRARGNYPLLGLTF